MAILTVKTKIELTHNASFEFNICIGLITILCTLYFFWILVSYSSILLLTSVDFLIKRIHRIRMYTSYLNYTKCNRSFMKIIPVVM